MGFNLKKILRALLFSTSEPLTIKDVQAVIQRYHAERDAARAAREKATRKAAISGTELPAPEEISELPVPADETEQGEIDDILSQVPTLLTATQIREAMDEIAAELEQEGAVCRLLQSSSGFKFAISKDYSEWIRLLRNDPRPQRLSRAALETLAIVAYRQPVTRAEIEAIRGVNADGALARLIEKELVLVSGRAELPGRPVQYSTTQNFLDFIGVNSLDELPASDVLSQNQISDWIRRASNPEEIKDSDVGLSSDEEQAEESSISENSPDDESDAENLDIEDSFEDVSADADWREQE